jgi:CheY-like chemotaxis protein
MVGDRERCLAAGADGYLGKPMNLAQLTQALNQLLPPDRAAPPR